jgi:hypothetical protein
LENYLSIGFLCKNWTLQFGKPDGPIFTENYIHYVGDRRPAEYWIALY